MVGTRVYLDHAATTAIRPSALDAYAQAARTLGNPSSQHASGRRVRGIFDDAVAEIADVLGVPRSWIIMTSGGTEADNLALRGIGGRVVGLATDHPAVVDTVRALDGDLAPVDSDGRLDLTATERLLAPSEGRDAAALVSAALVNNETGVIQDLEALSELASRYGTVVHTDAVQAMAHMAPPDFAKVPLCSITGHKIGAPVGAGLLVADPSIKLSAVGTGGGQQRGIRSGTLDAPHAAALAVALCESAEERQSRSEEREALAGYLRESVRQIDPRAHFTAENAPRSAHVVHVCFEGADQDAILFLLDQEGIDCSAGSACHAGVTQASHVLSAMGYSETLMRGAIRFSLGWTSTRADVEALVRVLPGVLEKARAVASNR